MPRSVLCVLVTSILLSGGCTGGGTDEGDGKTGAAPSTFTPAGDATAGRELASSSKCQLCHVVEGKGGKLADAMVVSVKKRVDKMRDYSGLVQKLKVTDPDRYAASAAEIDAIETATDFDEQLILWFQSYLKNTNFDDANNTMITPFVSDEQIQNLAAYLIELKK